MNNRKRNVFSVLYRIFNMFNFNKFLTIFIVGFVSRVLVGYFYSINIYLYFFNVMSILYYICMSAFIVLVHEFINYFIIPYFIIENLNGFYFNSLNNKLFMDSNVNDKHYAEIGSSAKARYGHRPIKSSPLSKPPITPDNIDEMKPSLIIGFNNKSNTSIRPVNINHTATSDNASPSDFKNKALRLKNNEYITKYKGEFKEFYTTYREFIKLSDYQLESLSIKIAEAYHKGKNIYHLLPDEDHKYLYDKFVDKKEETIEMNERKKYEIQQTNSNNLK